MGGRLWTTCRPSFSCSSGDSCRCQPSQVLLFFAAVAAACTDRLGKVLAIVKCAVAGTLSLVASIDGAKRCQRLAFRACRPSLLFELKKRTVSEPEIASALHICTTTRASLDVIEVHGSQ